MLKQAQITAQTVDPEPNGLPAREPTQVTPGHSHATTAPNIRKQGPSRPQTTDPSKTHKDPNPDSTKPQTPTDYWDPGL